MVDEKGCLFCKIIRGEIPAHKVYEDGTGFAFLDINPRNPGHTLVIPKEHHETLLDMPDEEAAEYFKSVKHVAGLVKNGVNAQGLSISSSNGQAAGQVVAHLHFHVIPRFSSEGPIGLEGMLPSKRFDEKAMNQLVEAITKASPKAAPPNPNAGISTSPNPSVKTRASSKPPLSGMPRPTPEKPSKSKKQKEDEDFEDLDEEISFDF